MTVSIILVILTIGVPFLAVGLDRWLKFYWRDARTRKHRLARKVLIVVSVLVPIACCLAAIFERGRAEKERQSLAQALENERRTHAFEGYFGKHEGWGQMYQIGDSGTYFDVDDGRSLLDMMRGTALRRIAEENSIVSKTVARRLLVSAKIRGRDGLLVEISDNEWKVSPPPRSWDRNYSTNALEVEDGDGNIVFQVKLREGAAPFLGVSVVSVQGIFFDSDGNEVAFTGGHAGHSAITFRPFTNSAVRIPPIRPLFKYPSSLHLGEPADER